MRIPSWFCAYILRVLTVYFVFSDFAEQVAKAKDIVEQSKHIQQLDSENKILKEERKVKEHFLIPSVLCVR